MMIPRFHSLLARRLTILILLALLGISSPAGGADGSVHFYVSPDRGQDSNPGTKDKPFATLQVAVSKLQPGDTLFLRGGTYRETVAFPRSGTAAKPITVKAYAGEEVVITGCETVLGWTKHKGNIWKAPMNWTLGPGRNQVFYGGEVMIEARFPNRPDPGVELPVSGLSKLWPTFGEFSNPDPTNRPQRVASRLLDGQAEDYWKGAIYYGIHYAGWTAQTGVNQEASFAMAAQATGMHVVFIVFHSDDKKLVGEFEYFRFEQYRGQIPLQKNEVKLEVRVGAKDGKKIGEFYPRFTGGAGVFREMVATFEPGKLTGKQTLFIVVRSATGKPIGSIDWISLEKARRPMNLAGLGIEPPRRSGHYIFPDPTHKPLPPDIRRLPSRLRQKLEAQPK